MSLLGVSVVAGRGGHQADPRVATVVVVPAKELATELARLLDRQEASGKAGPVLERLEGRVGVGVIGEGVGPVAGLGHAEVGEEERDRFDGHGPTAVGVDGQLGDDVPR